MTIKLNDVVCQSVQVDLPTYGLPYAEVETTLPVALSGPVRLQVFDRVFRMFVLSNVRSDSSSKFRLIGGRGGWSNVIPPKGYVDDGGVKRSTIIKDLGDLTGEVLRALPESRLACHYARSEGPAAFVMHDLCPNEWWVDDKGETYCTARPTVAFAGKYTVTSTASVTSVLEIAPETLAGLNPKATVGTFNPSDVQILASVPNGLRALLFEHRRGASRTLSVLEEMVKTLDPQREFRGCYQYRVVSQTGLTVNLQPVRVSTGMPSLERVPIHIGGFGVSSVIRPGATVIVMFADADPSLPMVTAVDEWGAPGNTPIQSDIDAQTVLRLGQGTLPVARAGDVAGIFPIVTTQVKVLV